MADTLEGSPVISIQVLEALAIDSSIINFAEVARDFLSISTQKGQYSLVQDEISRLSCSDGYFSEDTSVKSQVQTAIAVLRGFLEDPALAMKYVSDPDKRFLKKVVRRYPDAVLSVRDPDDEVLGVALGKKVELLSSVGEVSEEVLVAVVEHSYLNLIGIASPSERVQMAAVKRITEGFYISDGYPKFIEKLTYIEALKLFLGKAPLALIFIDDPDDELIEIAINSFSKMAEVSLAPRQSEQGDAEKMLGKVKLDEHKAVLVQFYPFLISAFDAPTSQIVEACLIGVKSLEQWQRRSPEFEIVCSHLFQYLSQDQLLELGDIYLPALEKLENLTEEVLFKLVEKDPKLVGKTENPSLKLQIRAVLVAENYKMRDILRYIKNPDPGVVRAVVARHPEELRFVSSPDEELQLLAVRMIVGKPDVSGKSVGSIFVNSQAYGSLVERLSFALDGVTIADKVQKELIALDYRFITLIHSPLLELQLAVFEKLLAGASIINNNLEDLFINIKGLAPEVQLRLVARNPHIILRLDSPHIDAIKEALKMRPSLIEKMIDPDPEIVRFAVSQDPALISILEKKFPEIKDLRDLADEAAWKKFSAQISFPDYSKN